jgi:hypothetical protein
LPSVTRYSEYRYGVAIRYSYRQVKVRFLKVREGVNLPDQAQIILDVRNEMIEYELYDARQEAVRTGF